MAVINARLANSASIDSDAPWKENIIKSVLFKITYSLLFVSLYKFFAYWAYRRGDYTSLLLLSESWKLKLGFIRERGWGRGTILAVFIFCWFLAITYDTILWALDTPGFTKRSKLGNGNDFLPSLLQNSSYVTIISDPSGDPDRVDVNKLLTYNIFESDFDFSFPPGTYLRTPNIFHPQKLMDPLPTGAGPRIYPDDGSFSVGFASDLLSFNTASGGPCSTTKTEDKTVLLWNCDIPIITSLPIFRGLVGVPLIWWGDDRNQTTALLPDKFSNLWASAGTEGGTAMMKQVFTVTNGARRHTFLQTTWKASMFTRGTFLDDEIKTILRRVYAPRGDSDSLQLADGYTQRCLDAQKNGSNSTTMGSLTQDADGIKIGWTSTEFFNLPSDINPQARQFSLLRLHNTTIEFVRSEDISPALANDEVKPTNAKNAKDYSTYITPNYNNDPHLNQIDTAAVALIIGILGNGGSDTNIVALNTSGMNWYALNQPQIDQLLLTRAFLFGGDASTVNVLITESELAIIFSPVQIFLIVLPLVLSFLAFFLMRRKDRTGLFRNSLFASLFAMTFSGLQPADLILLQSNGHVEIGMSDRYNTTYVLNAHKLSLEK